MDKSILYRYSVKEDILNAISHGIGVVFSVLALTYLSFISNDLKELVVVFLYSMSLISMFLFSTLYHATFHDKARAVLKRLDHCSIFLLITGSYIPYTFLLINSKKAYVIFAYLVLLTIVGIVLKIFFIGRFKKISTLIYIMMGWAVLFQINDFLTYSTDDILFYLAFGGIIYTVGALFYAFTNFKYHHFVWHLFVLVAAILQFYSIVLVVKL